MRLNTLIKPLFAALALFAANVYADQPEDFIVYEAQSRPADELKKAAIDISSGARISAMNTKVVIYGTKPQREAVLKLFAQLDHQLSNFTVKLRLASHGTASREATSFGGHISNHGAAVTASAADSAESGASNGVRELAVAEGSSAKLYSDAGIFPKSVTVHVRAIGHSGAHVEIREADSNAVGVQAIVTEMDLPLNEWRTIGGITNENSGRRGELFGHAKRSSMSSEDVQMSVSLA
ncbi:MAG: hypothetical protein ACXVCG_07760, partial [Bdellovibrionota bacterium]